MPILYNANIYTLDQHRPKVSALAFQGERILAVGSDQDLLSRYAGLEDEIDLGGRTILPGLTDAHIHLQQYALSLEKVDCETETLEECLRRIAERAKQSKPGDWILGHGWNQNDWVSGYGRFRELDLVAPQNPVYLTAKSLHAAWVNTSALQSAGIGANTPDPPDGKIQRDQSGAPTGILFEGAMTLIAERIPSPSVEKIAESIEASQKNLWEMGITGCHDFDRQACFAALQILHARDALRLRVIKSIPIESLTHAIEIGLRSGFGDDYLRIGSLKAFADGALGPRTAAMLQPYKEEPDNTGLLLMDAEELFELGCQAVRNGLSLAVHAIGDRANHEVLNAFEQLRMIEDDLIAGVEQGELQGKPARLRHRIEHVQVIHPEDIPRLAKTGVIASMQPVHATSDYPMADRHWGERAAYAYAWRSILNHAVPLAFGSDAPVESPNPFWGLHAAITRQRQDGSPGPQGWYPSQKLRLYEALQAYTTGAALAAGMADRLGRLVPGYLADLIVLEEDPFSCPPDALPGIRPRATMIGGEWVYTHPDLQELISGDDNPPPLP